MSTIERIYSSALKFLEPSTIDEVYEIVVREAVRIVEVQDGAIYLKDNDGFKAIYATRPFVYKITPRKNGNTYKAFSIQKTIIANVTRSHPELKKTGVKSSIFIPLSYENKPIGILTLDSRKKEFFDEKRKNMLVLFGSLASLAIRKAQLYSEIKESLETRDLFISLAAHELRTPLTTINGYIQLLLTKIRNKKPIDNKWIMELALEGKRMEVLVNEFLEIDRIKRGKLQYNWSEHSIKRIVQHAIQNFKLNNSMRKLTYKNKLYKNNKDTIVGDYDKLLEVITNILENADKYSPEKKKITVELKYKSPYFVLTVSDQGQGIEKKDLSQVFKGFYKGRKSLHEGMGLGLYLAKSIIDSHKGEIEIKSKVNKGTKVRIKLPKGRQE